MDAALDALYDKVDDLLYAGHLGELDTLLRELDVATTHDEIVLGYLVTTLPAKSKLPSRRGFCEKVKAKLGSDAVAGLE